MIYLDNAATTYPKPESVYKAVDCVQRFHGANPGRGGHRLSVDSGRIVFSVREKLAEMFGTESDRVIFTLNCTHAVNTALKGLLCKGDHVIISSLEHNSVLRPIEKLCRENKISYDIAFVNPGSDKLTLNEFEKLIRPDTKMIVCCHVSNVFGTVLPIKQISRLAKKHNILFGVDAAQSAGAYELNMENDGIDFLCVPGHKGLFGPMGTGVLLLGKNIVPDSLTEGGTGSMSLEPAQPTVLPDKLESGTLNLPGIAGLGAGIDFVKSIGIKSIHEKEAALVKVFIEDLSVIRNVVIYNNMHSKKDATLVSFNIGDLHSEEVSQMLDDFGFAVRAGFHCSMLAHNCYSTVEKGTIRVSPGIFNTKKEIKNLSFCVNKIAMKKNIC